MKQGIKEFFEYGSRKGIRPNHAQKLTLWKAYQDEPENVKVFSGVVSHI